MTDQIYPPPKRPDMPPFHTLQQRTEQDDWQDLLVQLLSDYRERYVLHPQAREKSDGALHD